MVPPSAASPSTPRQERKTISATRMSPMTARKPLTLDSAPLPSLHEILNAPDRTSFDNNTLRRVLHRAPFLCNNHMFGCCASSNDKAAAIVGKKAPFSIFRANNNDNNNNDNNIEMEEEFCPLFAALALGASQDVVRRLYELYPMALGETTRAGLTALHIACKYGAPAPDVIFLLRHCPSHASRKSKDNLSTPLHLACSKKGGACVEVIRALAVQNPSAFAETDRRGNTPLHCACLNKNTSPEVVRSIVAHRRSALQTKNRNGMTPLHAACLSNLSSIAAKVLAKKYPGAAIYVDAHGNVPAHYASSHGSASSLALVRTLLEVDPQCSVSKNRHGHDPYDVARSDPATPRAVINSLLHARDLMELGSDSEGEAAELHRQMLDSGWENGANLVLDVKPGLVHRMNVDERVLPRVLKRLDSAVEEREKRGTLPHVSSSNSLSAMFEVIKGLPEIVRDGDSS